MPAVMPSAQRMVSVLIISAVSIRKPNNRKNKARIRNAISAVRSLNLWTSLFKISGFKRWMNLMCFSSSRLPKKIPNRRMKISAGRW